MVVRVSFYHIWKQNLMWSFSLFFFLFGDFSIQCPLSIWEAFLMIEWISPDFSPLWDSLSLQCQKSQSNQTDIMTVNQPISYFTYVMLLVTVMS